MDITTLTKRTRTRHVKSTNTLKSSNFSMELDTLKAYSYDWWLFCLKTPLGVVFNSTAYSATTRKHQAKARLVLDYKADLTLRYTRLSLADLEAALTDEIANTRLAIKDLQALIAKPRTHKAKNEERQANIQRLLKHINQVNTFLQGVK